jgi:hypothetical protein
VEQDSIDTGFILRYGLFFLYNFLFFFQDFRFFFFLVFCSSAKGSGRCGPWFMKVKAQSVPMIPPLRCPSHDIFAGEK